MLQPVMRALAALALAALLVTAAAAAGTMQALVLNTDGTLALRAVARPEPGAGEVRIRVRAAGVNPVDWKLAERLRGGSGPPAIMGFDAAGIIDALGSGVTGWKVGDEVIAAVRPPAGSYAQYTIAHIDSIALKPKKASFEEAAGIPVAGETAWRSLVDVAHLSAGQRILIHGGAGGVGSAAVQIAHARGAHVIATGSANNVQFLRGLGADEVIDYHAVRFEQQVKDLDVVLNTADADTTRRSIGIVKPGGILVSIVGPPPAQACAAAKIRCAEPNTYRNGGASYAQILKEVVALADAGRFRMNVDEVLQLSQGAQAWQVNARGHTRGKLILEIPASE